MKYSRWHWPLTHAICPVFAWRCSEVAEQKIPHCNKHLLGIALHIGLCWRRFAGQMSIRNVYLVSRPETFCACEPANLPAKAGKLRSIFIKVVKIQKTSNSSVKHVHLSFRLAREVKIELSLCFCLIPRTSVLGVNLVSTFISWGAVAHLLMRCTA